jgi:hypothetical protein
MNIGIISMETRKTVSMGGETANTSVKKYKLHLTGLPQKL